MRSALLFAAGSVLALATPALAQHAGHASPPAGAQAVDPSCPPEHAAMGHCTPKAGTPTAPAAPKPAASPDPHAGHATGATSVTPPASTRPPSPTAVADPSCPPEHAAMGHCTPKPPAEADPRPAPAAETPPSADAAPVDPTCPPEHAAMGHCTPSTGAVGAAPPVAPPPQAAFSGPEHAADAVWDPQLMARKRADRLIAEHGGFTGSMVLLDRLEYRAVDGEDGYEWDAEAWYGGDYNRLWLKTEGEGEFGEGVESAEVQALYSRALNPWYNLQAGVRYDVRPKPDRAHLVLGVQGLAPYWLEIDAAAFLSDEGDLTARLEAEYDQRITNQLILQPKVEVDLAAQAIPELGVGAGLSTIEAGLRLRYEIRREFAPYVGVQYERRIGDTAEFARAEGEDVDGWAVLVGLRSWF